MFNEIIKKNYALKTKKINRKFQILLISDIHISSNFKIKKISKIIENIQDQKIDYICIPGDIIDNSNVLENEKLEKIALNFIESLSKISKVIISLGNHDISHLRTSHKEKKWRYDKNIVFFNKIRKIKNVYLLDDDIYTDKDICFIGLTLSFKYYKETGEDRKVFIEELNNKKIKLNKNKYNVLLCHSPVHILAKDIENNALIKDIDLILSGHMHNGMVHPIVEKVWKGNNGIITPTKKLYPKAKTTRGIVKKNDKILIISGGITKLSYSSPKIFHLFNDLFPMNIEMININD